MTFEERVPLAPLTTLRLGGAARFFCEAKTEADVAAACVFARERGLALYPLGGGSNILVPDGVVDGVVLKVAIGGTNFEKDGSGAFAVAGAGVAWDDLVARSVEEGLWGLENLSGIPGSVGGAVAGNIGAYGAALSQTLQWVDVFDCEEMSVKRMSNADCAFGYRDSFFKQNGKRSIILRAAFRLSPAGAADISYKDLAEHFSDSREAASPAIETVRAAVLGIRKGKFPDLSQEGTAGSFFKNPVVPLVEAQTLQKTYPELPIFALPESPGVKVPLAWILDKVLGLKGFAVGGARLFERQPLSSSRAQARRAQRSMRSRAKWSGACTTRPASASSAKWKHSARTRRASRKIFSRELSTHRRFSSYKIFSARDNSKQETFSFGNYFRAQAGRPISPSLITQTTMVKKRRKAVKKSAKKTTKRRAMKKRKASKRRR